MKIKLINIIGCKHANEVLLFQDYDDDSDLYVNIICWHQNDDGVWFIQEVNIQFENYLLADRFIADYSEASANEFANSFVF
jgi:hypothetical protein